jgi:hypothetical protein
MAGFGMIIGRAAEGWSEGRLSQIKAEREARLKELEEQRQDRRLTEERQFRSREAEIGRGFEAGEREKDRAATREGREDTQSFQSGEASTERKFRSGERVGDQEYQSGEKQKDREFTGSENEKTRAARREEVSTSADIVKGADGNDYVRTPDGLKPVTDTEGRPVKLASETKDKPAEVSTAEWLIQQGVAPDAASAWRMVRAARADPEKSRASIYKAWLDALTKGQLGTPDPAELEKHAREATEKTLEYLEMEDEAPAPGGGSGESKMRTQDTEEVGTAANVIPSDPAKRVVGKIYLNRKGEKARWTGKGWEVVR